MDDFWDRVRDRAYNKYLYRKAEQIPENSNADWLDAELEEKIEDKIREEAFLHFKKYGDDSITNYNEAKNDVFGRIRYLAYYMHERSFDKSPNENWIEAEKLYINEF